MSHHSGKSHPPAGGRKFHRDWRVWAAVAVMLLAMLSYVFTLDDSLAPVPEPGGTPAPVVPASP